MTYGIRIYDDEGNINIDSSDRTLFYKGQVSFIAIRFKESYSVDLPAAVVDPKKVELFITPLDLNTVSSISDIYVEGRKIFIEVYNFESYFETGEAGDLTGRQVIDVFEW